jgi:hypothetical protein
MKKTEILLAYVQDLADFSKATQNDSEYEVSSDMQHIAKGSHTGRQNLGCDVGRIGGVTTIYRSLTHNKRE